MLNILVKRLTGVTVMLLLLAGTMLLSSCATDAPITINFTTPSPLPDASIGQKYSTDIRAFGVTGPPTGYYTWTLASGTLPPGLQLLPQVGGSINTNTISYLLIAGTPTHTGTYTFTVEATDSLKPPTKQTQQYAITVQ
jgi:hypothetical protein